MCYSVIQNTEEKPTIRGTPQDLTSKEELWLAKLGSWTEALAVYQEKLERDPRDFEAILGCMRCLNASGAWKKVLDLAGQNWLVLSESSLSDSYGLSSISRRSQRKAIRLCAQAAWRLGQWDELEKYASQLVRSHMNPRDSDKVRRDALSADFDAAFYTSVLNIHKREWTAAYEAIDAARKAMDGRLTALMAESYSRAYSSMVTAQTLAEMEEIIEFRKLEESSNDEDNRHPYNKPDLDSARERLLCVWRDRLAGSRVDADVHSSILAVRSLVLTPVDEVDATLTLSELSRQAQRYKFAERVLLDPLASLNANLNGPAFGFGLSESLRARSELPIPTEQSYQSMIDRVVLGDLNKVVPSYDHVHQQWVKNLLTEVGGVEK